MVPADRRGRDLAHALDALGGPRVVADHVARAVDPVDRGHVVEDRLQRREVRVDVRDETDLHRRRVRLAGGNRLWREVRRGTERIQVRTLGGQSTRKSRKRLSAVLWRVPPSGRHRRP
ncbi:hypothetical protein BN903_92 [Halorubrum sp. AJ67]|nr:hypothetical protein BN903_92 [Halorubrum sp. AJ67]